MKLYHKLNNIFDLEDLVIKKGTRLYYEEDLDNLNFSFPVFVSKDVVSSDLVLQKNYPITKETFSLSKLEYSSFYNYFLIISPYLYSKYFNENLNLILFSKISRLIFTKILTTKEVKEIKNDLNLLFYDIKENKIILKSIFKKNLFILKGINELYFGIVDLIYYSLKRYYRIFKIEDLDYSLDFIINNFYFLNSEDIFNTNRFIYLYPLNLISFSLEFLSTISEELNVFSHYIFLRNKNFKKEMSLKWINLIWKK